MTVAKEPGHRGEHEVTVKTIARGKPDDSGVPVVTNARVYYTPRAAAGALDTRLSLRPLLSEGQCSCFSSGASRREMADARLRVYIRLGHGGTLQASPTPGSRI